MGRRDAKSPPLPPGSEAVEAWAKRRRLGYDPCPDEAWFRAWEPYDTMVPAEAYYNAVSWQIAGGTVTVAEPWIAPLDAEPIARTVLFFVLHPGFMRRAAARGGEHFNTRVAYLESPPPPEVKLGDPAWDRYVTTFAASPSEAVAAFPPAARERLAQWGFVGHVEVRPGGLVYNQVTISPDPAHLDGMVEAMERLVRGFVAPPRA